MSENWIVVAFQAWFGWKVLPALIVFAILLVLIALFSLPSIIRRARCKHERFHETGACDAICSHCGKNLGFIGAVRAERAKESP